MCKAPCNKFGWLNNWILGTLAWQIEVWTFGSKRRQFVRRRLGESMTRNVFSLLLNAALSLSGVDFQLLVKENLLKSMGHEQKRRDVHTDAAASSSSKWKLSFWKRIPFPINECSKTHFQYRKTVCLENKVKAGMLQVLEWSFLSQDMSPIEAVWDYLKMERNKRNPTT